MNEVEKARELVSGKGTLLFLTRFGSDLYGTRLEGVSDTDVRGVYLPMTAPSSLEEACMQKSVHLSTAGDNTRNAPEDEDFDLYPLERWLCQMLPLGNTGALDLLYAPTNPGCTLFRNPVLDAVFAEPLSFLNLENGTGCLAYCQGQGKTYGMAGTRMGVLYRVLKRLEGMDGTRCVKDVAGDIASEVDTPWYCKVAEDGGLVLAEQWHMGSVSVGEVTLRLAKILQGHLGRIEAARRNEGVDWKALSHAVRAIRQQEELLATGALRYPLACREELLRIKRGELSFAGVEELVTKGLAGLETLRRESSFTRSPDFEAIFRKARDVRRACLQDA